MVGAGINNSNTNPFIGFAKLETDFVFTEPFAKKIRQIVYGQPSREMEQKNRDKENELAVCENHVYRHREILAEYFNPC